MVRRQVHVHRADPVRGTHQIELRVPRQVAEIDRAEVAECQHEARRVAVVGIEIRAFVFSLHAGAGGVGLPTARQIGLEDGGRG